MGTRLIVVQNKNRIPSRVRLAMIGERESVKLEIFSERGGIGYRSFRSRSCSFEKLVVAPRFT